MAHIITFYQFADFPEFASWQLPLKQLMQQHQVKGTILLAAEGINATIAAETQSQMQKVLEYILADARFAGMMLKESTAETVPFHRAKVRLKKETITLKLPSDVPSLTGQILSPQAWNELLGNQEVVLLDTRNTYETHVGSFAGATIWPLNDFQELPEKILQNIRKDQKVAMFCTGGVRCEKLSSWMLAEGYQEIYQLEGGIVHYLNTVPEPESKWQGECYVFDDRVAVGHGCQPSAEITLCPRCGHTLTPEDRLHPAWLPAIQCGYCEEELQKSHHRNHFNAGTAAA
jgi:UPF0176 protein